MAALDGFLRAHPAGAYGLGVEHAGGGGIGSEIAPNLGLRSPNATRPLRVARADGLGAHARADLDARVGDVINPYLYFELEVGEFLGRAEKRIGAALDGAPDDGSVFDRVGMLAVEAGPTVERFSVEKFDPFAVWFDHAGFLR